MRLRDRRILVTGGAGLVGSQLSARLVRENDVTVVDDLSNGIEASIPERAAFVHADLTDDETLANVVTEDLDVVFHCAAADKYVDSDDPRTQFAVDTEMTHSLLERMDAVGVENVVFTSSSTVYGDAPRPTPEDYAPLEPISTYGAAKLAAESILSVYAHSHGFTVWIVRFANVIGPRSGAGVVPDFVEKLDECPEVLTILGDGRQEKSFMHVAECVSAIRHVVEHAPESSGPVHTYNLGTKTTTSVDRIADIVSDAMGLDPSYEYTGGDRGWTGDVPKMHLSIEKLDALGWRPELSSDESVRRVADELV